MSYGGILGQQQNIDAFTKEETYNSETQSKYGNLVNNPTKAFDVLSNSVLYTKTNTPKYQEVTVDLSAVSVGDIVQLPENGVLMDYLVVHIGNPDTALYDASCDGVWLLRKDIAENGVWNSSNVNTLPNSTIMTTMAGYLSKFPSEVQTAIKTVKIPYCVGNGSATVNSGANGLECKVFPLSLQETGGDMGAAGYDSPSDGVTLDYFISGNSYDARQLRVARFNGQISPWGTRSPKTESSRNFWIVIENGAGNGNPANVNSGIRPAFIMTTTASLTFYVDSSGTVHDAQEYETAGTTTDVQGNPISIGAKLATGSYVGTGTYGASNPNTLTFEFPPKLLIIGCQSTAYQAIIIYQQTDCLVFRPTGNSQINVDWSNPLNLKWYANDAAIQMNVSNYTYSYVYFG